MAVKLKKAGIALAVLVFWLLVWHLLSDAIDTELMLPSPSAVAAVMWRQWSTGSFWVIVGASLLRVLGGFAAAVVVGSVLAVLTTRFSLLERLLSPILHIVRAAPVASFILSAYFWVQLQLLPAFIAFLMVVPLIWANVSQGIAQTDYKLLEMSRVYRLGRIRTLRHVYLPSVLPYFEAACTTGLGFAWKSGIAAEVICSPSLSVGKQMYSAKAYLEMSEVSAWTVTVVLLSVVMERVFRWIIRSRREVRV